MERLGISPSLGGSDPTLNLKVAAVQVIITLACSVYFAPFYSGDLTWSEALDEVLQALGMFDVLTLNVPAISLSLGTISWPSSLPVAGQMIMGISVAVVAVEYAYYAFRWAYYNV